MEAGDCESFAVAAGQQQQQRLARRKRAAETADAAAAAASARAPIMLRRLGAKNSSKMHISIMWAVVVALALLRPAAAAPLPLHLRWLHAIVPPSAAGPVLKDFFWRLPAELCGLGLEGLEALPTNVMDELCPLKATSRIGRVVPAVGKLAEDAAIAKAAAMPVTIGGGLMLMASSNATEAADLQRRLCDIMIDPRRHCGPLLGGGNGTTTATAKANSAAAAIAAAYGVAPAPEGSDGDELGPLAYHLDAKDSVAEFLASKMLPLALSPVGMALKTLPDALCALPADNLAAMPKQIRYQLCPYDVALVPVVALFAMGRTGSSSLEAKLCDVLKHPATACANGRYRLSPAMAERMQQIQRDTAAAVYSWEPKVPKLPRVTLPALNLTSKSSREHVEALANWWDRETAPELRRYALSAFLPPALQQPASMLLERLPDSICALPRERIEALPLTFKANICPFNSVLRQAAGGGGSGGGSSNSGDPGAAAIASALTSKGTWATALAEVVMGGSGGKNASSGGAAASSRARVERWVVRMCSAIYAPDVSCGTGDRGRATAAPSAEALQLVGQRVKPVSVELVTHALDSMPAASRQRLVDGVARQLELWGARARAMPRPMAKAMFGPFCPSSTLAMVAANLTAGGAAAAAVGGSAGSSGSPSAKADDVKALVVSAALEALRPRDVLEAIVGEQRADAATVKVCGALLPSPPPASSASSSKLGKIGELLMKPKAAAGAPWPFGRRKM